MLGRNVEGCSPPLTGATPEALNEYLPGAAARSGQLE